MELKLIPHQTCPDCGSITVAESCRSVHTCGEGFEERTFHCGCVIAWSPNFSRLETKTPCPKRPDQIEKKQKRAFLIRALEMVIDASAADDEYKSSCKTYLPKWGLH